MFFVFIKYNYFRKLIFIMLLIASSQAFCGSIIFNKANSPYIIDSNLVINSGDTLIIMEGTVLMIDTAVDINIFGHIFVYGTVDEAVSFLPMIDSVGWGKIQIDNYGSNSEFNYALIKDGTFYSKNVNMTFFNVDFINTQDLLWSTPIIEIKSGSVNFLYSSITGSNKGEGLLVNNGIPAIINNCYFTTIPDAVEFINSINGRISNSIFENIPDDAIDLNFSRNILIDSNIIFNASDRAMEIGNETFGNSVNIKIKRNLIAYCHEGIIFKDGSSGKIINNTLYGNDIGIRCAELVSGYGGGSVIVENTIISNSIDCDISADSLSEILISYSLSDNSLLPGDSNIFDDPQFVDPAVNDFNLRSISPCIDKGNPGSPIDPDSTIADIGAYYYDIEKESKVKIDIYDLSGKLIKNLINKTQSKAHNSIKWKPKNSQIHKAGIYFCRISVDEITQGFKIIYLPSQ
ncbi:MAG: right-handed parallel beta-helix repeat-containing protein [Bacteroidales bacterium]|nr:right-handed parallel beta-helix repeat-containing protein [Bacteroidales bacterium]